VASEVVGSKYRFLVVSSSCGGGSAIGAYGFHDGLENVENPGAVVIVENPPKLEENEASGFKKLLKGTMVDIVSSCCVGKLCGAVEWGGCGSSSLLTTTAAPSPLTPTKLKLIAQA
jgi:hypothetical protein